MSANAATLTPLLEYATSAGRTLTVDREKGVISRVKVLGEASDNRPPNNNVYPRETRERAAPLMEGARVYIDHGPLSDGTRPRSYRDAFGVLRSVSEGGDGLYADYHFPPKHPLAEQLFWDAENAPDRLGFSISSNGRIAQRDGKRLVEEIVFNPRMDSVDLVSRPATTRGLREHLETTPVKKKLSELIEALKSTRPGYSRALREFAEAGIMSPSSTYAEPAPAPADAAPAEAVDHEQAILDAAKSVLDDTTLDNKSKMKKIKQLLDVIANGSSSGEGEGGENPFGDKDKKGDGDDAEKKKTEESLMAKQTAADVKQLREEMAVRDLVDDAKLSFKKPEARKAFIKSLVPLDEAARKELIAEHAGKTAATEPQKPKSSGWGADPDVEKKRLEESRRSGGAGGDAPQLTDEERAKRVASARSIR